MGNNAPSLRLRILLPTQESRALSSLLYPPRPLKQHPLSPIEVTILPEGKSSHDCLWLGTTKPNNQTLNGPCPRFHHQPSRHLSHLHPSAYPAPLLVVLISTSCSDSLKSPLRVCLVTQVMSDSV